MVSNTAAGRGQRFARRFPVRFGIEQTRIFGFSVNLSSGGLAVTARRAFKPPAKLTLKMTVPEGELQLFGEVRWCKKAINSRAQTIEFQMGIMLLKRNEEYIEFLKRIIQEEDDIYHHNHPIDHPYAVTYETQDRLVREYDDNIRRNGIFIPTSADPPLHSPITFTINLLEVMTVLHGQGTVIQLINQQQAQEFGTVPGVCLEITQFADEDKELLTHYVSEKKARMAAT